MDLICAQGARWEHSPLCIRVGASAPVPRLHRDLYSLRLRVYYPRVHDLTFARSQARFERRRRRLRRALTFVGFVAVCGVATYFAFRGGASPLAASAASTGEPQRPRAVDALAVVSPAPPSSSPKEPTAYVASRKNTAIATPEPPLDPAQAARAKVPETTLPTPPPAPKAEPTAQAPAAAPAKVRPLEPIDDDMIPNPPKADRLASAPRPLRVLDAARSAARALAVPGLDLRRAQKRGERLVAPASGGEAVLTLLPDLQAHALSVLERHEVPNGAFVAIEPSTGKVLALASYSRVDPRGTPFALRGIAPAASIFKLVSAAALLEASPMEPDARACFRGGLRRIYKRHLQASNGNGRCVDLARAVAWSYNAPIAKMAVRHLEPDALTAVAEAFGFNTAMPFDVALEPSYARIPSDALGFGRSAAGFGDVRMSALHGALLAAAIANGGQLMRPFVVEELRGADGAPVKRRAPEVLGVAVSPRTAERIAEMMKLATTQGTGRRHLARRGRRFLGDIAVPGKTGSLFVYNPFMDYSWFVGFAPAENPKIAFASVVGNTPIWHIKSGYLAIEALRKFFGVEAKGHKPPRALRRRKRRR
jgi:hypothetical protein